MKKLLLVSAILTMALVKIFIPSNQEVSAATDYVETFQPCVQVEQDDPIDPINMNEMIELYEDQNISYYTVSEAEREMLARLVFLESSICSFDCQIAVASVVFNRLDSGAWGDTLAEVVYYPNAFSPSAKIPYTIPDTDAYAAVDYVIENGPTVPSYVRYFRTSYDFSWNNYINYDVMDNVYFGYLENWERGAW